MFAGNTARSIPITLTPQSKPESSATTATAPNNTALADLSAATEQGPSPQQTRRDIIQSVSPDCLVIKERKGGDSDLIAALKILAHQSVDKGQIVERPHIGKPYSPNKNNPSAAMTATVRKSDDTLVISPPNDPDKIIRGIHLVSPDGSKVLQRGTKTAEGFEFSKGSDIPGDCIILLEYQTKGTKIAGGLQKVGLSPNLVTKTLAGNMHCRLGELFSAQFKAENTPGDKQPNS